MLFRSAPRNPRKNECHSSIGRLTGLNQTMAKSLKKRHLRSSAGIWHQAHVVTSDCQSLFSLFASRSRSGMCPCGRWDWKVRVPNGSWLDDCQKANCHSLNPAGLSFANLSIYSPLRKRRLNRCSEPPQAACPRPVRRTLRLPAQAPGGHQMRRTSSWPL